jgi:hypothetical protein
MEREALRKPRLPVRMYPGARQLPFLGFPMGIVVTDVILPRQVKHL